MDVQVTFNAIPAFLRETIREARQAVKESAEATVETAKESLRGSKSGRVYHRRGRVHQASAPGEPAATEGGGLENSGSVEVSGDGFEAAAVFDAPYAEELELGTPRIAARPFLAPATEAMSGAYIEAVGKGMNDAARKVGK